MERLRSSEKGFTLLELLIAVALFTVVMLASSNLLVNFGNFSTKVVKSEASLMGTALGTFEEIVGRIRTANLVTIPATGFAGNESIEIRVSQAGSGTSSDHTNDTIYTYRKDGTQLKYKFKEGTAAETAEVPIAKDISILTFTQDSSNPNGIQVVLEANAASGATTVGVTTTKEHLETTAIMRSRSAG